MSLRLGAILLLLATVALLAQSTVEEQRQELYTTRARLEEVERRLANLRSEKQVAQNRMMEDEDRLRLIRRLNAEIELTSREREVQLAMIRRAMYGIYDQIQNQRVDLEQRLVNLYKYGRLFELDLLLSSKTMPDVFRKLYYLRMIAEANQNRVDDLTRLLADLNAQQSHFKYAAASLRQLQDEYTLKQRELQADKAFRSASVTNLSQEETAKEAQAEQLAAAADQIEQLLKLLENEPGAAPKPAYTTMRGDLPWPVDGRVTKGFGDETNPAYGTQTRNTGLVIECAVGVPVKAVGAGRVSYAEEFMTYGNLVIVDHGAGTFSVYGNLKDIDVAVGDKVEEGVALGHANASLYFELRKAGGPIDPRSYLR